MTSQLLMAVVIALSLAAAARSETPGTDSYGGWTGVKSKPTGFFHVQQIDGRWWIITPEGNAFFSKGVCHISFEGDTSPALNNRSPYKEAVLAKYKDPDPQTWAKATTQRLQGWGLNTVGAWSNKEFAKCRIPYTLNLDIAAKAVPDMWWKGLFPDLFDPAIVQKMQKQAEQAAAHKDDPWLLGYFLDNEIHWQKDWRNPLSILDIYLKLPATAPGHQKAKQFLAQRNSPTTRPTQSDADAFLAIVADEYFRICHEAIRKHDPNHMILGCRFAGTGPLPVLGAMKDRVDVVSAQYYDHVAPIQKIAGIAQATGRPVLISEFGFKAMDSGLPNSKGGGIPVKTQQQRAELFENFATALAKLPACVGYHWFQYADEPKEGRFDGEDCNYGLVKIDDTPWDVLTERMKQTNAKLDGLHAGR